MGSWIRRGVLHTPKNKFVANAVGVAALGDPQCIVEMVLNVGAGPVSAQTKSLLEQFLWRWAVKIAPTIFAIDYIYDSGQSPFVIQQKKDSP